MGTVIRPEISAKSKYWIDKHRHYELKHFCLQYPMWKKGYADLEHLGVSLSKIEYSPSTNIPSDLTCKYAVMKSHYSYCIGLVESAVLATDEHLFDYILKAVTEGLSYTYLKSRLNIPCSRDRYYELYRKFFWILSNTRK